MNEGGKGVASLDGDPQSYTYFSQEDLFAVFQSLTLNVLYSHWPTGMCVVYCGFPV